MSQQLKAIQQILIAKATPEAKAAHQKFVPSKEKIYGVRNPILNELAQQYKTGGFDLIEEIWKAGALEEKLLAVKMLGKIAKKDPERSLKIIQLFATNIGNWAVCDAMGMQGLKPIVKTHQKEIFALARKYNTSTDFWQRRLSLVLVEWYTRVKELHPEIKQLVKTLENDEEYYVKKAVVWINKNFTKNK
jgi:3-methyladenine DNA glycosylase AlkD